MDATNLVSYENTPVEYVRRAVAALKKNPKLDWTELDNVICAEFCVSTSVDTRSAVILASNGWYKIMDQFKNL